MKKNYKIEVDCANCANLMEQAARKTPGVKDAVVNFMALKMSVEFEEGADPASVMPAVQKACKKVETDCEICLWGKDVAWFKKRGMTAVFAFSRRSVRTRV